MKVHLELDVVIRPIEIRIRSDIPSASISQKLTDIFEAVVEQGVQAMATAQEVLDGQAAILETVTTEAAEVKAAVDAQAALIAELQAIIAAGGLVTVEQLQAMADGNAAIQAAVAGIFTPTPPVV